MKNYISPEFEKLKYSETDVIVCSGENESQGNNDGEIGKDENEIIED